MWFFLHEEDAKGQGQWPKTNNQSPASSSWLWPASWSWISRRSPQARRARPSPGRSWKCWRPVRLLPPRPRWCRHPAARCARQGSRWQTPCRWTWPRRASKQLNSTPSWRFRSRPHRRTRAARTSARSSASAWCSCWWRRTLAFRAAWARAPPRELPPPPSLRSRSHRRSRTARCVWTRAAPAVERRGFSDSHRSLSRQPSWSMLAVTSSRAILWLRAESIASLVWNRGRYKQH